MAYLIYFSSQRKTGGGGDDAPGMTEAERHIASHFDQSHAFHGIPNAVDSGFKAATDTKSPRFSSSAPATIKV
jgi:hypothetical protein